jgi:hypothetical protein
MHVGLSVTYAMERCAYVNSSTTTMLVVHIEMTAHDLGQLHLRLLSAVLLLLYTK